MILLKASDFGLPQRRVRLFILGINKSRAEEELTNTPEEVLELAIGTYLPSLKMPCPPVASCLILNLAV